MKYSKTLLAILTLSMIFSCSRKIAYTSTVQLSHNFSEENMKKVQFYTSDVIILVQTKQEGDVIIQDGKLVLRNSKDIEKIVIPKNTPCVLERIVDESKILVSFEQGNDKVLLFGNNGNGCYSLMSKDWNVGVGTIPYANKNYKTTNGNVFLLIAAKKLNRLSAKERTVKGRKI